MTEKALDYATNNVMIRSNKDQKKVKANAAQYS